MLCSTRWRGTDTTSSSPISTNLQEAHRRLDARLDALYTDKVDGKIEPGFFERKQSDWQAEQTQILTEIEIHQRAKASYFELGVQILELAQHAHEVFQQADQAKKRQVLETLYSNSTWADGLLEVTLRQPFDLIAVSAEEDRREQAAGRSSDGLRPIWLPGTDLNRRHGG